MAIWGKIIGGAAGFALGGPLGAILGVGAGHLYDRAQSGPAPSGRDQAEAAFTLGLIVLAAKLSKADGVVTRDEVDAFKQLFRISPEDAKSVARVFDAARQDASGFEPFAAQLGALFRDRPAVLEELLDVLFRIAAADGAVTDPEIRFIQRVSRIFGLGDDVFERVRAERTGGPDDDPYSVLGVKRGATDDEIKKAYRKLIRENHPDRLIAEGMPEDFVDVANQRMATINAAYDRIAKARELK